MTHERRGETEKTRSNTSQLRRGEREYGEEAGVEGIRYKYDVGNDGKEHVWVEPADGKKDKHPIVLICIKYHFEKFSLISTVEKSLSWYLCRQLSSVYSIS